MTHTHTARHVCSPLETTVNKESRIFNNECSRVSGASSKRMKTVIVRRLVSHVDPIRTKAPAAVGVSISYPTSDQVRPRLVHSQKLGTDLVLQTPPLWLILAAALCSFMQQKRFLHVRERHRWNFPSAHSANREFVSKYSRTSKHNRSLTVTPTCY